MKKYVLMVAAASVLMPVEVWAQDTVVVTASRIDRSDYDEFYDDGQSAIGLTRTADFFVKPIYLNSDSRDPQVRRSEVNAMLLATIELAEARGISLVAGEYKLSPLTKGSMDDLLTTGAATGPTRPV